MGGSGDDPSTEELRAVQSEREQVEREQAERAEEEEDERSHRRRAERAAYLREKLDDQADSEQQ